MEVAVAVVVEEKSLLSSIKPVSSRVLGSPTRRCCCCCGGGPVQLNRNGSSWKRGCEFIPFCGETKDISSVDISLCFFYLNLHGRNQTLI